eukprot:CAMPEP_0179208102 /NCGR_PEP_ID=MMETSP0796-20121207/103778_1 /TAXON_ID=73915 /ORGANISM="Pyrodinium bahamense, Strain pbaha01" /LENGTH=179 /DNA_ID=CAMNT_0020913045 /DNA_START=105 /DNA_END=644 /DNA_ORIENTATION=-
MVLSSGSSVAAPVTRYNPPQAPSLVPTEAPWDVPLLELGPGWSTPSTADGDKWSSCSTSSSEGLADYVELGKVDQSADRHPMDVSAPGFTSACIHTGAACRPSEAYQSKDVFRFTWKATNHVQDLDMAFAENVINSAASLKRSLAWPCHVSEGGSLDMGVTPMLRSALEQAAAVLDRND